MKHNLLVQQFSNNSLVKVYHLTPGRVLRLGQDRQSNIRISSGCGQISFAQNSWQFVLDGKKLDLNNEFLFEGLKLKWQMIPEERPLFSEEFAGAGFERCHLVIVKKDGKVLFTETMAETEVFTHRVFMPSPLVPKPGEPQTVFHNGFEVVSRVISVDRSLPLIENQEEIQSRRFFFRSLATAVSLLLSLLGGTYFKSEPEEKTPEQNIAELKSNKYTKMVYNSEDFKQAQQRAQEILKESFNAEVSEVSESVASKEVSAPTQEVIKGLQSSGLGDLIGRIAQNSVVSADSVKVAGGGGSAGTLGQRGLASASSSLSGKASADKGRFQLAGVKTAGLAGSKSQLNGIAALAKGRTGSGEVNVLEEETVIEGGLEPEVIAGVIRQHLGEVRYCYERQLGQHNDLEGKVQLNFAISADGSVSWQKVSQTTLNNAMVEGCILRRVAKWKFPNPKGGTSVHVTYPFLLKSIN